MMRLILSKICFVCLVQTEENAEKHLARSEKTLLRALKHHTEKKKKRNAADLGEKSQQVLIWERRMSDCAAVIWRSVKFFQTRETLDWDPSNSACVISATMFQFPLPKADDVAQRYEPQWWGEFRKYLNGAIANKRGHVMDEIKKKLSGMSVCV